jgi:hypothetical protein
MAWIPDYGNRENADSVALRIPPMDLGGPLGWKNCVYEEKMKNTDGA